MLKGKIVWKRIGCGEFAANRWVLVMADTTQLFHNLPLTGWKNSNNQADAVNELSRFNARRKAAGLAEVDAKIVL